MSPCSSCHAGCCRAFAVPITGADILRIMNRRGVDFWDFVCRWSDPKGTIARNFAPQFYFQDDPGVPYVICLILEPSEQFPGTTKCRFLHETPPTEEHPLGVASCSIHSERPSTCRAFPTRLSSDLDLVVLHDVPASGRPGQHEVYNLCPRPFEPSDIDPLVQFQDLIVARGEMKFFHSLADSWNRDPGAWSLFPEFLKIVYSSRVQMSAAVERDDSVRTVPQLVAYNPLRSAA